MRSTDLTGNQLDAIREKLDSIADYFRRLEESMVAQDFDESHRLCHLAGAARKAIEMVS